MGTESHRFFYSSNIIYQWPHSSNVKRDNCETREIKDGKKTWFGDFDADRIYLYLNTHTKSYEEHSEVIHEGNPTTAPKPV